MSEDPQAVLKVLREWIIAHCTDPHPVREAAAGMARSAIVHRLLKYGPDESLNVCSARDLLALLVYVNGPVAEYVLRTAYIRAIVEGDHEVYEHLNTTPFIPDVRAWYWQLVEAMLGKAPDAEMATAWLQNMRGEELSVARLILARAYPDLAHPDWLADIPENVPRLAAELCLLLIPKHREAVVGYLREHPEALYAPTSAGASLGSERPPGAPSAG